MKSHRHREHLSSHLKDHAAGVAELEWARRLVAQGKADWSGGKPVGLEGPARTTSKAKVSDAVLEDRR